MNVTIGGIARTVEITSFDKLGDVKVCMLTTTADGSVGFQQLNQEVIDTIYASFPVDTSSGEIASFEDGADNVPVRELKLNLEPYQNLNGYDSPWVGGAGKNKFDVGSPQTYTHNGVTFTVNKDGTVTANGTSNSSSNSYITFTNSGLPDGNYIYTGNPSGSSSSTYRTMFQTQTNGTWSSWSYFNGESGNITISGVDAIAVRLIVMNGNTVSNIVWKPMIRLATESDATYAPYENICPIYPANGKNLISPNLTFKEGYIRGDDGTETASSFSHYSQAIAVSPSTTYTISTITSATTAARIYFLQSDGTWISRSTSYNALTPITFDTPSNCGQIQIQCGNQIDMTKVQLEVGKYATPYVPYNAIGITRTGKNLLSADKIHRGIIGDKTFTIENSTSTVYRSAIIKLSAGYWTFTFPVNVNLVRLVKDGTYSVITNSNINTYTINTTTDDWVGISWRDATSSSTNWDDSSVTQVEKGSASTGIEPYQGERYYPISNTPVYGGTLDVTTGVLTVTTRMRIPNGTGTYESGNAVKKSGVATINSYYFVADFAIKDTLAPVASNSFKPVVPVNPTNSVSGSCFYYNGQLRFTLPMDSSMQSANDVNSWFSNNTVQFIETLVSPLTYQLTPTQVKTLLGYNNIWTDSGTVEVQYLANIGLYIQKIIGATEDDMVANQNISANKYFFVGETLYYSTSAISAGQTIVVGTNCIKTNLADALNALNS